MTQLKKRFATGVTVEITNAAGDISCIEHKGDLTTVNIKVNDMPAMILKTFREVFIKGKAEKETILEEMLNEYRAYLLYERYIELAEKRGVAVTISSADEITDTLLERALGMDGNARRSFWGVSKYKELETLRVNMAKISNNTHQASERVRLTLNNEGHFKFKRVSSGTIADINREHQEFNKLIKSLDSLDDNRKLLLFHHLLELFPNSKEKEFIEYLLRKLPPRT